MKTARYPLAARLVHWTMAALILTMLGLGLAMVNSLAPWRTTGLWLHKLGGVLVLALVLLRIALRLTYNPPPLPVDIGRVQRWIASASHAILYLLMIGTPLSGWAMQSAAGVPVILPGSTVLPSIAPENLQLYGFLRLLHGLTAWASLALVALHAAAALHHQWVRRDSLMRRMI